MKQLVVIGGSDAGISAALRAREVDSAWEVTVVVADCFPNYSICGLPFFLSGETPRWESLAHRTLLEIEAHGIRPLLDTLAERIDPTQHRISIRGKDGSLRTLDYDRLVLGTGAVPRRPRVSGLESAGVYVLHSMGDSFAVQKHLLERSPGRALIVGGGYIGLEVADALRHRGLAVSLWEVAPTVLQTVDAVFGDEVRRELERHGVEVHTSVPIERIEPGTGERLTVDAAGGLRDAGDLALVVTGVQPCVELGTSCGILTGHAGALSVNRRMETNVPDIYAAGDCVETHHRLLSDPVYLPLGTTAHKQGRIARENAVGGQAEFEGSLGTQVIKVFGLVVGRTGLRDHEATRAGFDPITIETTSWDHKAYYPGATELRIRVRADRRTHMLLGAQVLGHYGAKVSKRIDIFATALFHRMRVTDLSYTPPLGSPWDPVQLSALSLARASETASPLSAKRTA